MALDSTAKAIATQAWTQLLDSILSREPPTDMSKYYFYRYEITDFNHFQHNLKRLEIHKYKLGTENIRARMSMHSQGIRSVAQANEDAEKQGIEHIQYSMRSGTCFEVVQTNEDENQLGIEHIQYSIRSGTPYEVVKANEDDNQQGIEHIQYSMRSGNPNPYEAVQANEDEIQQGIEHVQYCMRSGTPPYEVVQANEHENVQGMEHIQYTMRSSETFKPAEYEDHKTSSYVGKSEKITRMPEVYEELVDRNRHREEQAREILALSAILELVKNGGLLGEEEPVMELDLLEIIECLHGMEANTIRMALEEEPENMNQKYDDTEHTNKKIELFLRIFGTENCQLTMCKVLRKVGRDCTEHYEVVKAKEGNWDEMKHIPYCIRHTVPFDVVRTYEHRNQQMLKRDLNRKYTRSTGLHKVLEETEFGIEQPIDNYEAKKLFTLFDELLELVEIGELHGNVKPKPETSGSVVDLMKLLYHYGLDIIQTGVEEELKDVNQKCDNVDKDPAMQCKKRLLEIMLRICSTKTCQTTIYQIIGRALRGQMWRFVDD